MKKICLSLIILLSGSTFSAVNAQGTCENYPYRTGFDILTDENGQEKFFATAEVSVPIDDNELYMDSMEEAEIEAKSKMAKFINEEISGSTDIEKKTKTKIRIDGEKKSLNRDSEKTKVKYLKSKIPQTLMRGVRVLGSCYTPGKKVRVSVGWRLQDSQSAEKFGNTMRRSNPWNLFNNKNNSSDDNNNSNNNSTVDFNPVGGYSDTRRFDNF